MEPRREGSKLRLKRSKKQEQEDRPAPGGTTADGKSSPAWFQKQDLSSAERMWMTLLMAADPALDGSGLEKVAGLPPFLPKSFHSANPRPKPEPFSVGATVFEWVPFPVYSRANIPGKGSRSHGKDAVGLVAREKNDEGGAKPRILEEMCFAPTYGQTVEGSKMQHCARHSTKLGGEVRIERRETVPRQDLAGPSTSTVEQHHGQRLDFQRVPDGSAMQGKQGKREKEEVFDEDGLASSVLSPQGPLSANVAEAEKAEKSTEGLPDLDQCPMCQMNFTGTWSRLNLDRHLAQCLSESTEDMVW